VADPPVREPALRRLREGVELDDGRTAPARVRRLAPDRLELTLHEGRNRQVKRMCAAVGHRVRTLERIRFGPLRLADLAPGRHRRLTPAEVERLRQAAVEPPRRSGGDSDSGRPSP
jgi:23S rRNA pseudouridine2605 synthase